jgi:hypothetical protein
MTRAPGGIKSGFVHIRAFMAGGGVIPSVPQGRGRSADCLPHAFFFTSLILENVMPSARSWV